MRKNTVVNRFFTYDIDGKIYQSQFIADKNVYVILTKDNVKIGVAQRRKTKAGFVGKLTIGNSKLAREIICQSLKALVWWIDNEYQKYLAERETHEQFQKSENHQ